MGTAPPIPLNVVEYLEGQFPDRAPSGPNESMDVIRYKSGQVHVVRHLRAVYEDQINNFAHYLKETS